MKYRKETVGEMELDCLINPETGDEIRVAPKNGLHWTNWLSAGRERLWHAENFFDAKAGETLLPGGSPLLFPSVGRTWNLSKKPANPNSYIMPDGKKFTMPIHGFGAGGTWTRIDSKPNELAYSCAIDEETKRSCYPFDIKFTVSYSFNEKSVRVAFNASTEDDEVPFAFGIHPYFAVKSRENIIINLPTCKNVPLRDKLSIPFEDYTTAGKLSGNFRPGLTPDFDTVLDMGEGDWEMTLSGGQDNIQISADKNFGACVLYTDDKNPFMCVEPWTRGLGGFTYMNDEKSFKAMQMPTVTAGKPACGVIDIKVI